MPDMGIDLESFKGNIVDLCRPNRFLVDISTHPMWEDDFGYLVKGASIPSRTIGEVVLQWNGMAYKVPADPTFDDFTLTFLNDIDCSCKEFFETWLDTIANMKSNERAVHSEVKYDVRVQQLNGKGEGVRVYTMKHCHPKQIDAIELDHDTTDTVENFAVTFSYSYFEVDGVDKSTTPNVSTNPATAPTNLA